MRSRALGNERWEVKQGSQTAVVDHEVEPTVQIKLRNIMRTFCVHTPEETSNYKNIHHFL